MFTAIFALDKVSSPWLWFAAWQGCMIVYFCVYLLFRQNRNKDTFGRGIVGFAILAALYDLVSFIVFFPEAKYVSRGELNPWILAAYPFLLAALLVFLTIKNHRDVK